MGERDQQVGLFRSLIWTRPQKIYAELLTTNSNMPWSKKAISIIIADCFLAVCGANYYISLLYRIFFASSLRGYAEAQDTRTYLQS